MAEVCKQEESAREKFRSWQKKRIKKLCPVNGIMKENNKVIV